MNLVVQIGRLVADPQLRYTQNGTAVTNFRVAVNRSFLNASGEREADFFNVIAWNKLGETCANNLSKGRLVAVRGRLQSRSYDDQNGAKRHVVEIIADSVEFLDSRKENGNDSPAVDSNADYGHTPDNDIPFDDIPF